MKYALLLLLVPGLAVGCPKGSSEWRDGCVVDIEAEVAVPVKPSDERPPSDRMPSYQREGISIVDAPNTAFDDAKQDREKAEADAEGKRAAGLTK